MGAVYRAESTEDGVAGPAGSTVAIKVFHSHLVLDPRAYQRFRNEAEFGRCVRHPNVVRTFGVGDTEVEGEPCHYMVMEYVEGQTLDGLREELGTLPDHLLYLVADQTLDGLSAIHEHGVVHRDLKPENIVITTDHKVLIMDLGVARLIEHGHTLTERGEFVGTLTYAAPEQFDPSSEIDEACDLYSFGVVLYELATGHHPFADGDLSQLLQQKLQGEIDRPRSVRSDLDGFWDEVIVTCLSKRPADRFGSAAELRGILQAGTTGEWWGQRTERTVPSGAERALKRLGVTREAPFVGRAGELARLEALYAEAKAGEGRLVFLGGASGTGKSRLAHEFVTGLSSAAGPRFAAGRAVGSGGRAYQAYLEMVSDLLAVDDMEPSQRHALLEAELTRHLPDLPGVVPRLAEFLLGGSGSQAAGPLAKDALFAALAELTKRLAAERPLVLLVEDLHQADDGSVELLGYLARGLAESRSLLLGIYDEEQVGEESALQALITGVTPRGEAATLSLAPLSRAACDDLVRSVVHHERTVHSLSSLLHQRTDGNPLIILEVIAHLRHAGTLVEDEGGFTLTRPVRRLELPARVTDLLDFMLARLDDEQRETLETAAVLGEEFEARVLAAMLEERRIKLLKRLAILERRHRIIRSTGKDAFQFTKRQLHAALYQGIPPDLREEYHSLAADTLLEVYADTTPLPGEVAYQSVRHLLNADRGAETAPHAVAAATHVVARYHATHAAAFLERLVSAQDGADPAVVFDLLRLHWECYEDLGRRDEQLKVLQRSRELSEALGDAGRSAQVRCLLGVTRWRMGDYETAQDDAEAALALAREAGNREWEANALHSLGAIVRQWGDYDGCARSWQEALAIRRETGDRHGEARSLASLGVVMPEIGEGEQALAAKEEALAIFRELGERRGECAMLNNIGNTLVGQRRIPEAAERFEESIRLARALGSLAAEGHPTCNLGRAYVSLGRMAEARESLARSLEIFRETRVQSGVLDVLRALGEAHQAYGQHEEAIQAFEEGLGLADASGLKPVQCEFETSLAAALHAAGRRPEAWASFERAKQLAEELHSNSRLHQIFVQMGLAALTEEDATTTITTWEEALAVLPGADLDTSDTVLTRCRLGRALHLAGRRDDALEVLGPARAEMDSGFEPSPHAGTEILYTLGLVLGAFDEGAPYVEQARQLVNRHAASMGDRAYRSYYLTSTWPASELTADTRGTRIY